MLRRARVAFVLLAAFALFPPFRAATGAQGSTAEAEQRFVELANGERRARGVPALAVSPDLVEVARRHAARMAAENRLHHNPNLGNEVEQWEAVGENVGTGTDAEQVHAAFMESPRHRDNILSGVYTQVGVGVAPADDGGLWVAQVFRKPASSEPPPPPPPSTTTTTAPAAAPPAAEQPPATVRTASARPVAVPAGAPPTSAEPAPASTTVAPAPAPAPEAVAPAVVLSATTEVAEAAGPPTGPNPGRVMLAAQPVPLTTEPEVSLAVAAAAGALLLVVAGQTATFRRLRLV